jgi:peptide deformylase
MRLVASDHPILRTVCRSDFSIDVADINQMFELMRAKGGLGLAAPQVGIDARLFVTGWGQVFVDPQIVVARDERLVPEGCLSLPGVEVQALRFNNIVLANGERFEGLQAQVIQHEIGHLNGILITDGDRE